MMKAVFTTGKNVVEIKEIPKPTIQNPDDVVLRVTKSTICGSDLSLINGHLPVDASHFALGHEGMGIVEEVGSGVRNFKKGDKVLMSCTQYCGACTYCKQNVFSCCDKGGVLVGVQSHGTHSEYVRVMHADRSLYKVPDGIDEEALLMCSDILPTAYETGVIPGGVKPGCSVAIFGMGPVGLCNVMLCNVLSPRMVIAVDLDDNRLEFAKQFGATHTFNPNNCDVVQEIKKLTDNNGVDVAIEAVGSPHTFDYCQKTISKLGTIANCGVHGKPVQLNTPLLSVNKVKITFGVVDTNTTPELINLILAKKIDPKKLVTHRFKFDEFVKAYDVFMHAPEHKAVKVVISNE